MARLKKMRWNQQFSIGNSQVDEDHKTLIEIYNNLVDLIEKNGDREYFSIILSQMTDFVLKHFENEEEYMRKFNYPHFDEHKDKHDDYSYKVAMYNAELLGDNPPDPSEIISYIEKWWKTHILTNDARYEKYKRSIGSSVDYKDFSS